MSPMCSEMAFGAHGHMHYLEVMVYHRNSSLRAAKKKIEAVERQLQKRKKKTLEVLKIKNLPLLYITRPGVHNRDPL